MYSKYYLSIMAIVFVVISALANAHTHTISGSLVSATKDKTKLLGVNIRVLNTMLGAVSNNKGNFLIKHVPEGKQVLSISSIGYETKRIELDINHGDPTEIKLGIIEMEESSSQTPDVVVTATRSEKVYEDVPVKISVLSDKVFANTASTSLKEGLNFQPGLRVETNCQNCGFTQVRLNGLEGKYSQILIDGKAIYSSLNGVYGLEQIPTNMIDKVEVIRGGGSSLYGGNAIAGVINIITKTPSSNLFKVGVTQSYTNMSTPENVIQLNAALVNEDQNLGIHLFGTNQKRDEWDANGDGFTELGRLNVKTIGANMFYKPSYLSKITAEYHTVHHEIRGGDSLDLPPHQSNITETTKHNTNVYQLQYEQYIGGTNTKFSIYASHQNTVRDSYYGANHDLNAYGHTDNKTWAAGTQFNHIQDDFAGTHIFTAGYEYNNDEMQDLAPAYNRIIDQKVNTHGFYLQDDWEFAQWADVVLGARLDKHNLIDKLIFSPRANLLIRPITDLSFRVSYSTGYRAPQAFDEDLHITQVGGEGMVIRLSDNLKPEYSMSVSGSLDYVLHLGDLPIGLSVEYFHTKLDDAFTLVPAGEDANGNAVMMRKNGESATVQGGTFEIEVNPSRAINFKAGATLQSSKFSEQIEWSEGNDEEGIAPQYSDKILRTPDAYGFFTINWQASTALSMNLSGVITGPMYVPHYAGGIDPSGNEIKQDIMKKSESFFELNSKVSYKFSSNPGLELFVGMQNLLNQFQKDFDRGINRDAGYMYGPGRPRTVFLGIQAEM